MTFLSPADATYWLGFGPVPGRVLFMTIYLLGLACFAWIVWKRIAPLLAAQSDPRFDRPWARMGMLLRYWFGQWRHPRYRLAGAIHILIFAGFLILFVRAFALLLMGISSTFAMPGGPAYRTLAEYSATVVFCAVVFAAIRRAIFKPVRYRVPSRFGRDRSPDAIFLLALIAILMLADGLFEGSLALAQSEAAPRLSLAWFSAQALGTAGAQTIRNVYLGAYLLHGVTFFFLLCYRPFGVQFHVESSLFSIYFAKLDRGTLKPVRWGIADGQIDQLTSYGVKTFTDFTWKHILDFYSCADCGRCSDQCPANAVGRPLSPRFLTVKARDYAFAHFPVMGRTGNGTRVVGAIVSEEEVWSCTTCGACEAECPMLVEYIDKIVDLRRGLVDESNVPQSLQKPLKALESRGNPFGKLEKKRSAWADGGVRVLDARDRAETLYFADSITSYGDRIQSIGKATVRVLDRMGVDFGILGAAERDSGHDVRRLGEETLFRALRDHNTDAIRASGVRRIVTADPHAYNALRHDYVDIPPVEHMSQTIAREVASGNLRLRPLNGGDDVYTYHDPCYLGRHNGVFNEPRAVLDSIPGLRRVEMKRHGDRSFCCGGGGLALFYEAKEDERIGVKRVRMAAEAGANVIVTACPFCLVNLEDAIKVAGMEGRMTAVDFVELVERQIAGE